MIKRSVRPFLSSLFLSVALLGLPIAAPAAPPPPKLTGDTLIAQLRGPVEGRHRAIDAVIARSQAAHALDLSQAAEAALDLRRYEDAAFLFYAFQIRRRFDLAVFIPPREGPGSEAPMIIGLMNGMLTQPINSEIMRRPKELARVVERLEAWQMEIGANYNPGWVPARKEFKPELATQFKEEYMSFARDLAVLLNTPDYFEAYKIVLFNFRVDPAGVAEKTRAEEAMRSIEQTLGRKGYFYSKQQQGKGN